ncbi:hypothetical protein BN14_08332 [Rhizoctonia solani AG-1 IB]|uniref:Uncharacterized protein n=1 Tax=Thanatephorus cucumeris (strain AG1-IB / isolate 7/3/14) TaxID=1108050 RepID=M5C2P2_THACB|nr:hypothetical protein BN14_08332 [Rhizoctonia solani AG-1 IB]
MPAADPEDQQAARAIESTLRDAVKRAEQPPVELEWFMALPKRIRRSAQLIKAAQVESGVLLEHVRTEWNRSRKIEQDREDQLARARTQPRDLECLRAPDPTAWHGLGRRKKRSRAFEMTGRAYNTRQKLLDAAPSATPDDVFLLHPSSCYVPKRSPTPLGLRDSMRNVPGLIYVANGPANPADYGLPTPASPISVDLEPPVIPLRVPSPTFPYEPRPGEFCVHGSEIDPDIAYVVAHGRHSRTPEAGYSAVLAAVDIYRLEQQFPDALGYLERLLFPDGACRYSTMVDSSGMEPLLDFVFGWFDLSRRAREVGK